MPSVHNFVNQLMVSKFLNHLKSFSLPDLLAFAFYRTRCALDCYVSSIVFRVKCFIFGVKAGSRAKVWGKVYFHRFPGSQIKIGSNVRIISSPYRYAFNIFPQSKLRTFSSSAKIIIGDGVGFNSVSIVARSQTITIGDGTMIGGNCQVMDTDGHPLWPAESRWEYPGTEHDAPVNIGKNVFIGLNVIILKGVTIGDNAVIAAGSVVCKDVPTNALAAGVPAAIVKIYGANDDVAD